MEAGLSGARILHLFANFKWTGPADPAIRCARDLRLLGADVVFAEATWTLPAAEHRMRTELSRQHLPVIAGLELRKHFRPASVLRDARRLRARLDRGDFDVVHAHLRADHLIAAIAKRRSRPRPVLVRTLYEPRLDHVGWRDRVAFRYVDGVVAPTRVCREEVGTAFGLEPERILYQDPPADSWRRRVAGDLRQELGLARGEFAIGITARIQPHRRFDLLWQVAARVVAARPHARFVLLGRGNERDAERLVAEPVRRAGLQSVVRTPGYLYEPAYSRALRSLDAFLFLVPGSDRTCRAVREAMALGLPVVATDRGVLPELLGPDPDHADLGPAGTVCRECPERLAAALVELIDDPGLRRQRSAAAVARADGPMHPGRAARRLLEFYERLLGSPRRPRR